ncbi:hypothetical protein [Streptomyces sp. NPDC088812]|uniref:hypothetical protein n=1 Tax=Streptomyces sp. NPDC088812 TaxID=3365905 RepID=UPI003809AE92
MSTLPFDFTANTPLDSEEDRLVDQELCKGYLSRWAGAFGSGRQWRSPSPSRNSGQPHGGWPSRPATDFCTERFESAVRRLILGVRQWAHRADRPRNRFDS